MSQMHDDENQGEKGNEAVAPGILAVLENRRPKLTVYHHTGAREFFVCEALVGEHVDAQNVLHGEATILARMADAQEGLDAARVLAAGWEMQDSLRREGQILRTYVQGLTSLPASIRGSLLEIADRLSSDSELPDLVEVTPCEAS